LLPTTCTQLAAGVHVSGRDVQLPKTTASSHCGTSCVIRFRYPCTLAPIAFKSLRSQEYRNRNTGTAAHRPLPPNRDPTHTGQQDRSRAPTTTLQGVSIRSPARARLQLVLQNASAALATASTTSKLRTAQWW